MDKRNSLLRLICCALLLWRPLPGWSQQTGDADTVTAPGDPIALPGNPERRIKPDARALEEIVVLAQKRPQAEIDVPIAISVIDAGRIEAHAITDLADASLLVPNTNIQNAPVFPDIRIRGFGTSPINPVFEQSVGLVKDGVPYGSKFFYQGALFDLRQIEVLRGPQGALHGKNTTAGLVQVLSQRPGAERAGRLGLQWGDQGHRRLELAQGGPLLGEGVQARLALLDERRGGFMENTAARIIPGAPANPGERQRRGGRLGLRFPSLLAGDLNLQYERSSTRMMSGTEFRRFPEHTRPYILRFDPAIDFTPDNLRGSFDHPHSVDFKVQALNGHWQWSLPSLELGLIAGRTELDQLTLAESDFSPAPVASVEAGRETYQNTLELRGVVFLGDHTLTAGALHQRRNITNLFHSFRINDVLLAEFLAVEQSDGMIPLFGLLLPAVPTGLESSDATAPAAQEVSTLHFDEVADTTGLFAQWDWQFLPRWALAAGLRWTREQKDAHIRRQHDSPNSVIFRSVLRWEEFDERVSRHADHYTPKLSLNWRPREAVSLFLSWSNGFKAGGFNAFASAGSTEDLLFEPETVSQWALDAKLRWSRARLNLSLFQMQLKDFQVLTADPADFRISIKNAARSRSQGLEADFSWALREDMNLFAAAGFNATKFLSFPIATCPQDRPNSDGDDEPRCDVSGKPLVRAPRWMLNAGFDWKRPLGWRGLSWLGRVSAEYMSSQYLNDDMDERKQQDAFVRLHASLGLAGRGWTLRLSGQNLTDTRTSAFVAEVPSVAPEHFFQIPEPGRRLFLQLNLSY